MAEGIKADMHPQSCGENILQGDKYRITILTEGLVRLEYDEDGAFEDRATQVVLNRDFPAVGYTVKESEDELEIFTKRVHLIYNKKEFTSFGLSIQVLGNISNYHSIWHYGEETKDLLGTARTLDRVDGPCELEHGLMSEFGFSVLDDSRSLIITDDGWVEPRKKGIQDIYFWGYGHDYVECLNDFYYLCGKTPMLPRFALGNWWSRYYEYTEDSYMELMNKFDEEKVPFSVAVIDMDWHLVDIDPKYGSGWTGYTWNKDFFPDPERFLQKLHQRGMRTTLNVHPADGVRAYEEPYEKMAQAMGIDPASEEPVNFDISDPKFLKAYLEVLHHPYEDMGVDFWWLDWQQGSNSKIEGLDPLWMLNHYHYLDSARNGKRPMTFSRYAGPGSHRYPIGFSGDTHTTWDSLEFQPYFTNTASNIGYGWWSHDIGGHMLGYRNDEMEVRWIEYGVFSPVNRLHSTKNEFFSKEPWIYEGVKRETVDRYLRLRHELLPYLYTMNWRAYSENKPIIWPMYYLEPEKPEAYQVPNQYLFGTELLVAPITTPDIAGINMGKVTAWLPEGTYIDVFTGLIYKGNRSIDMYRDIKNIPVLAKAGAIVPMTDEIFGTDALNNPKSLKVKFYAGANGSFSMYEDDNETTAYMQGVSAVTDFEWNWNEGKICIQPVKGEASLVPESRDYTLEVFGCKETSVTVYRNGQKENADCIYAKENHQLTMKVSGVAPTDLIEVAFDKAPELAENDVEKRIFELLNRAEISIPLKGEIFAAIKDNKDVGCILGTLYSMNLDKDLLGSLLEIITA